MPRRCLLWAEHEPFNPSFTMDGILRTPVKGVSGFSISCQAFEQGASLKRPSVGFLMKTKPRLEGSIYMQQREFDLMLAFAAAGKLKFCQLTFDAPKYGRADVHSAMLSTQDESDETLA